MGIARRIREQAEANGTTIQDHESAKLEQVLNNLFFAEKEPDKEAEFVKHVMDRGTGTHERVGLHASSFITSEKDWCDRRQVLSMVYRQIQSENVPVSLKRIFEEGNAIHEKWQRLFIRGGFAEPLDCDLTQYDPEYGISFTPDIICTIPEIHDGKMIVEIKSVNTFQYQKMSKHPSAGKQLQWYMYLSGIHKGFVLSEDKNTQDFKIEMYEYDSKKVAEPIDRADRVLHYYNKFMQQRKMVKRPPEAVSTDCKLCDKCPMKNACWNVGFGRVKIGNEIP